MANPAVGSIVTAINKVNTAAAPGGNPYGYLGADNKAKVKGYKTVGGKTYMDLDFTPYGGGTGWAEYAAGNIVPYMTNAAPAAPRPAATPTPATSPAIPTPRLDFVNAERGKQEAKQGEAQAKVQKARDALIGYFNNLPSSVDRYNNLSEQYGVSAQQALVDSLGRNIIDQSTVLENIDPEITKRSGEFTVNEAQRQAMVRKEQEPLLQALNKLLTQKEREEIGLSGKQNTVNNLMNLMLQDDARKAKPYELELGFAGEDKRVVDDLVSSLIGRSIDAYGADVGRSEDLADMYESQRFEREMSDQDYARRRELAEIQKNIELQLIGARNAASRSSSKESDAQKKLDSNAELMFGDFMTQTNDPTELRKKLDVVTQRFRDGVQKDFNPDLLWALYYDAVNDPKKFRPDQGAADGGADWDPNTDF